MIIEIIKLITIDMTIKGSIKMNEGDTVDHLIEKIIHFITILIDVYQGLKFSEETQIENFYVFK